MKEIMIKIPEYIIDDIKECGFIPEEDNEELCKVIINGTVLPKHGRLIDADALSKDDEITNWITRDAIRTGKMLKTFSELFLKKIYNTPTILEATGEEE